MRSPCREVELFLLLRLKPPVRSSGNLERMWSLSLSKTLSFSSSFFLFFSFLPSHCLVQDGPRACPLTCHMFNSKWLFGLHPIHLSIYHGFSLTHTLPHVSHGSYYSSCLTHSTHDTWHLLSHSQCDKCPAPLLVPRKT